MSESYLQRRSRDGADVELLLPDLEDNARYPALVEFLWCTRWPDGARRQPGTLLAFVDGPNWKVCLTDRDQEMTAFLTAPCLLMLLDASEKALRENSLEWRPKAQGRKK